MSIRRALNQGPASSNEVYDALLEGGYVFHTRTEQIAKISLTTSLGKNPKFYKLPNKKWGLKEWYPKAKQKSDADNEQDEVVGADSEEVVLDQEGEK